MSQERSHPLELPMLARAEVVLYECLLLVLSVLLGPLFVLHPRGRRRLQERFGFWGSLFQPQSSGEAFQYLWFHAASVGEVAGLVPVLERMRQEFPQYKLLLTCTSPTGLDRGAAYVDAVRLVPFDCRLWLRLACRAGLPRLFVVTETEIWPALYSFMQRRKVPLLMINARLGVRSFRRYRQLQWFILPLLEKLALISVSSPQSAERLHALGIPREKLAVDGNSKYDRAPQVSSAQRLAFTQQLFSQHQGTQLLVLGSIRPQEEQFWFPALSQAFAARKDLRVVIAPRHQENFEYFAQQLQAFGIPYARWSRQQCPTDLPVVLLDAMGLLEQAYSGASLAFIGATLVPIGGHNPLEAAAYAVPLCMGPHVGNVAEIIEQLEQAQAAWRINTVQDAASLVMKIGSQELMAAGLRAQQVWQSNRGASERIVAQLARFL